MYRYQAPDKQISLDYSSMAGGYIILVMKLDMNGSPTGPIEESTIYDWPTAWKRFRRLVDDEVSIFAKPQDPKELMEAMEATQDHPVYDAPMATTQPPPVLKSDKLIPSEKPDDLPF